MELDVKIKNGTFDLTASGIILLDGEKETIFTIKDNGKPIDIKITFKNDNSNPQKLTRTTKPLTESSFAIDFINYNSALGSYTREPWGIGTSFNRKLYLSYMISGFPNSNMKKFEYSFYLGEEVNHG